MFDDLKLFEILAKLFYVFHIFVADLPSMKLRTTHRMNTDTFNTLIKLGAGLKKKKKKGKKV